MIRRPPTTTRTNTIIPMTTLFRSRSGAGEEAGQGLAGEAAGAELHGRRGLAQVQAAHALGLEGEHARVVQDVVAGVLGRFDRNRLDGGTQGLARAVALQHHQEEALAGDAREGGADQRRLAGVLAVVALAVARLDRTGTRLNPSH